MPRDEHGNWSPINIEGERISAATLHSSIQGQSANLVNQLLSRLEDAADEIAELRARNAVLDAAVTAPIEPAPKVKRPNARRTAAAEKAKRAAEEIVEEAIALTVADAHAADASRATADGDQATAPV